MPNPGMNDERGRRNGYRGSDEPGRRDDGRSDSWMRDRDDRFDRGRDDDMMTGRSYPGPVGGRASGGGRSSGGYAPHEERDIYRGSATVGRRDREWESPERYRGYGDLGGGYRDDRGYRDEWEGYSREYGRGYGLQGGYAYGYGYPGGGYNLEGAYYGRGTARGMLPRGPTLTGGFRGVGPVGYQRSDERIMEDVCEVLTLDDLIDASGIEIRVARGEVTLSGFVPDRQTKRAAEEVIEDIPGVTEIHNQLRMRSADRSGGGEASPGAPPVRKP